MKRVKRAATTAASSVAMSRGGTQKITVTIQVHSQPSLLLMSLKVPYSNAEAT